jgi:hypothetical protein
MRALLLPCALTLAACGGGSDRVPDAAAQPTTTCGSVRYTWYTAAKSGWCEYDRTAPMLPASVRAGLTLAIAEPWAGSSYGGVFGEACGECWEIASLTENRIIMVHDLCPIEGNPVCNGSHFHVDLSGESKDALAVEGIGEASGRRVPCPVAGNAHLQILDRNQWGYLRFQVINHRIPVRAVEFRSATGATYFPAERSGGAWHVLANGDPFVQGAEGGVFRLTSAQGEVLETPNTLPYSAAVGAFFDLGAQFTDQAPASGPACTFTVPPDIYADGYGGIEDVQWIMNPWGSAKPSEVSEGCVAGTCLRISGLEPSAGFHIYYYAAFSPTTFRNLRFFGRTESGEGRIVVMLGGDSYECSETKVGLTSAWAETVIDLGATCPGTGLVSMFTVQGDTAPVILLDNVRLEL